MNKLNVIYEDNHVIVVEKKFNILSQADKTGDVDMLSLVKEYVKFKYNKPSGVYIGLVHRLDRPTGGLMVFARTSKAASRLSSQVREHIFSKTYLAIINSVSLPNSGEFLDYIVKDDDNSSRVVSEGYGKLSKLSYEVLERNLQKGLSLVKVNLKTGRHHQIRVQFASRGYPLYGDRRYGAKDGKQLALFASELDFVHPTTKEMMHFSLVPPREGAWDYFKY